MADDTTPPADGGQAPAIEQRVGALETGQETLSGKINQVLGILGGGKDKTPAAPEPGPGGGEPPDGIAMEIRRQLDARTAKDAADEASASTAREVDALKQQVAALAERRPEPAERRIERMMWGGR